MEDVWICKTSHFYGQLFAAVGLKEDSVMLVLFKELWCGRVFFKSHLSPVEK